jgi:hypothetical protein
MSEERLRPTFLSILPIIALACGAMGLDLRCGRTGDAPPDALKAAPDAARAKPTTVELPEVRSATTQDFYLALQRRADLGCEYELCKGLALIELNSAAIAIAIEFALDNNLTELSRAVLRKRAVERLLRQPNSRTVAMLAGNSYCLAVRPAAAADEQKYSTSANAANLQRDELAFLWLANARELPDEVVLSVKLNVDTTSTCQFYLSPERGSAAIARLASVAAAKPGEAHRLPISPKSKRETGNPTPEIQAWLVHFARRLVETLI